MFVCLEARQLLRKVLIWQETVHFSAVRSQSEVSLCCRPFRPFKRGVKLAWRRVGGLVLLSEIQLGPVVNWEHNA
jgi:hypothetical protein